MHNTELLKINPKKVIRCIKGIVSDDEIKKIEKEIEKNANQLIRLGENHLRLAKKMNGRDEWRQKVSRGYYACYSASKAIRLAVTGSFSEDSADHKRIGELPDNFPNKNIWQDLLTKFRADRNIADYSHSAREKNLEYTSSQYLEKSKEFIKETKKYLKGI